MKKSILLKEAVLLIVGGAVYFFLELLWKGSSHWTMAVLGGLMFLLVGGFNEFLPWEMPLVQQGIIGMIAITVAEFASGCILNLWFQLGIWDYSLLPLNLMGQICLPFMAVWFVLSIVAVVLDDILRWKLWGEEKPHYTL